MMKTLNKIIFLLTMLITFSAGSAFAEDKFYVDKIDIEPGTKDTLKLILDNQTTYYGFQAVVTLPEGLSFVKKSDGKVDMSLDADRTAGGNYQTVTNLKNELLNIAVFSASDPQVPFVGIEGTLATIEVEASEDFKGGDVTISGIKFVKENDVDQRLDPSSTMIGVLPISIKITNSPLILDNPGDTGNLNVDFYTSATTVRTLSWKSYDENIATVDESGVVTAVKAGTTTIVATTKNGKTARCLVGVGQDAEDITLDHYTLDIFIGKEDQLIATVLPDDALNKLVSWSSSDERVATVDENGVITAHELGTASITAKALGSGSKNVTATCFVTVIPIPAESVIVTPSSAELMVGQSQKLEAEVLPVDTTFPTVTWSSSNPEIATVDELGNVTAVALGQAIITATCGDAEGTCEITVIPTPAQSITLDKDKETLQVGDTTDITAIVLPEDTTDKTVTWTSSDESIATVDAEGKVTAISLGKAIITAKCGDAEATCEITVVPTPVESIALDRNEAEMKVGENLQLIETILPENATDKTVIWTSSNEVVATVDANGVVTALVLGEAIITVTANDDNNLKATCKVTVVSTPVEGITLEPTSLELKKGETAPLTAIITPEDATDKTITWTSSDETIAKVDNNGVVTAISLGSVEIIASSGEVSATCNVKVIPTPAERITLSQDAASLEVGETVLLIATVYPETTTDKTVTWSSADESIATVDSEGNVLAIALGEVDIIAKCGEATAICKVTVVPTNIGSISLSNTSLQMIVGDKTDLTAAIFPPDATDPTLIWKSSDESIVTVEGSGMTIEVSALKAGTAVITVSSKEGISATCDVTVSIIPVKEILLDRYELEMIEGDTDSLIATVLPENATDKSVTWKSSDINVATVSDNGEVTAVGVGTATIYASSSNGLTAECIVTVKPLIIEATGVTITTSGTTLRVGQEQQLNAIVTPANTTNPEVSWKSSDESIATVDATGKVTAVALGETIITATCGNASGESTVYVVPTPIESITLSNTELILKEGDLTDLIAIINPADATDKTLAWSSSDESVITLSENTETVIENGVKLDVSAHKAGSATITVWSPNEGKSATCQVTVNPILAESISLNKEIINLIEGDEETLIATITPDNASDKTVTWKSSDLAVATVSSEGVVTATGVGTATIFASTSNGLTAECKVEVEARIIYAISVTLDKESAELEVAQNLKLNATLSPDNVTDPTIIWTSSDESIAIVDAEGNVTAIALGNAIITAACGEASASCAIQVVPTPATDMSLSQYELLMREGHTADIIAIVRPDNATDKSVTWKSSDESIASVDANGIVTAVKTGVAVITATTNGTISKECIVTVVPNVIAVEKIEIVEKPKDGSAIELDKDEAKQLTARIEPDDATDKTVTWKSSNEDVATVSADGVVTAIKEGSVIIFASSSNGLTDECPITVLPGIIPVESISLSNTTLLLDEGDTTNLIAIVHPDNATDKEVIWSSSDESVATVDQEGNVTAISEGTAIITATSHYDNSIYKSCEVTVEKGVIPVTGIHIVEKPADGTPLELELDDTLQLHVVIEPEDATDKSVTWKSSDPSIATVSEDGTITIIAPGEVVIYASSSNGLTDEITLKINRGIIPVLSLALSNNELLMRAGATSNLIAIINPEDADDKEVIWSSSDESVATVDQEGNINAISAGVATITAASHYDASIKDECVVTVLGIVAVTDLILSREELELIEGDSETLTASIVPDDAADKTVTWKSSDRSIAVVDESGVVTAVAPGIATIYATSSNGITKECKVTVHPKVIEVTSITLDNDHAILEVGQSIVLSPTVAPDNATDKTLTWESADESIAVVDENGNVTAKALGKVIITVTCGNVSAECDVEVVPTMPTGITLTNSVLTMTEGTTSDLIAIVSPDNATDKTVVWTSDNEEVATVNENGIISAIRPGVVIVTATTVNGLKATCTVTVIPVVIDPSDITMEKELTITEGDTYTLSAVVTPENATDKSITWRSSNTSVATVEDGVVTAISAGNAIIYASTSNGKTAECNVTVIARIIPASSITLDIEDAELHVGDQLLITPTVTPDNVTDKTITWTSSDTSIATVDENGNVTAVALGETEITATCGDVSATCLVKVVPILPTSITLSNTELIMREGHTSDLIAIVLPINATDKSVTWSSTEEAFATVDNNGIVTAIKEGTATIIATTHNGLKAYCVVTVVPVPVQQVTEISLNKTKLTIEVAQSEQLIATLTPADAADQTVTWISLDQTIATVDADGVVTGMAPGIATIMASAANGLSATCEVTVILTEFDDGVLRYRVLPDNTVEVIGLVDPDADEVEINTTATYTSPYVTIEFTVTKIADDAFVDYPDLDKVVLFTDDIPEIDGDPFSGNTTIYVADPDAYKNDPDWGKLPNVIKGYVTIEAPEETPILTPDGTVQIDSDIVIKGKPIIWTSSHPVIASVDNDGLVTMHYVGHTTITATCDGYSDSFVLPVYPQRGDANWDGIVNVADPVNIANYVVRKYNNLINWNPAPWATYDSWTREYWDGFYDVSSDINGQEGITVSDASETVSIILSQPVASADASMRKVAEYLDEEADALTPGKARIVGAEGYSIPVKLANTKDYVALQADIRVAAPMTLKDVKPGMRAAHHKMSTRRIDDQTMRIVLFDLNNSAFAHNDESIFEIVVDRSLDLEEDIEITNIVAADIYSNAYALEMRSAGEITGVDANTIDEVSIKASTGSVIVSNAKGRQISVFALDGAIVKRYVAATDCETISLTKGIYVVTVDNKTAKINVK